MAEPMVTDGSGKKNPGKRKRWTISELTVEERETRILAFRSEIGGLLRYYKEGFGEGENLGSSEGGSVNSAIACLLEERDVSLSKLVDEIYNKMKGREGVTVASVKSSVLLIGQRTSYGMPNADADVLEDGREDAVWCWETRDLKLMPKSVRGTIKNRRTCREKIHERIVAICEMIAALQKSEDDQSGGLDLKKATKMLDKALSESDIRLLQQKLEQRDDPNKSGMEAKKEQKDLMKQLEKSKRKAEKARKRLDRELEKEKKQSEKEIRRLQDEAEKEEKRHKKEERRQEEEAEKEQRRREKEEAEKKKQLSMQKQASIMERFLKKSKNSSTCYNQYSAKTTVCGSPLPKVESMPEPVTQWLDYALSQNKSASAEDILKGHLNSWRSFGREIRGNRKKHWGIRKLPKIEVIKELKLSADKGLDGENLCIEKLNDGCSETENNCRTSDANGDSSASSNQMKCRYNQLLQYDKSHRPAFYGIWLNKSRVIGPRHPFKMDPDLDYDIDSDEEWEEEEPGESLSDGDKDDEEECLQEGNVKVAEDDESDDGFFVPDGYLSESEGVEVERKEANTAMEDATNSRSSKQEIETEEIRLLLQQMKQLHSWTEHSLRKNKPLIIVNIKHDKASLLAAEELTGTEKLERTCLQALSMRVFPGFPSINITVRSNPSECEDTFMSDSKDRTATVATTKALTESDWPQLVSIIQVCSQSIGKILESLQQNFPSVPKYILRNKVREISGFVDNRWRVKKEILDKLGLSISPEKSGTGSNTIASFFSKRCLPPGKDLIETSTISPQKPATSAETQPGCSNVEQQPMVSTQSDHP